MLLSRSALLPIWHPRGPALLCAAPTEGSTDVTLTSACTSTKTIRRTGVAVLTAGVFVLSGCTSSSTPEREGTAADTTATTAAPTPGGTLTFARTQSPTSLDLHTEITANNAFAIDKIFEPLLSFNAQGEIEPWLASEYSPSEDGLVWTFTLRPGVRFSTGDLVTPEDVVYSLNRHIEVGGPLPLDAPITSIEASGTDTVVITLSEPYTPFIAELAGFSNGILPADLGGVDEATFFKNPVGTGPFVVDEWTEGGDISFTKNVNYWQDGKPYLDELVYKLVQDDNQLVAQLQSRQVDVIDSVASANVATLEGNSSLTVSTTPSWVVEEIFFNTLDEHFADRDVRRAVSYALDREGIVAATSFGTAEVAGSVLPPSVPGYDATIDSLSYDLAGAKASIAASAYPDGFSTKLLVASGNTLRAQEAQIVQAQLAEIGITVEIESIDLAAFRERFRAFDYSFMINSATSDVADPNGIVSFQADPEGGTNGYWTHYNNPEVTALIAQGRTLPDGAERTAVYSEIQATIAGDAPFIPLSYPSNIKASQATVQGLTVLPNGSVRLQDTWLTK
ncbi:peptide/nickel transport system substrate-binding protein [Sanguibacter gelidistatuariae]|uniref:Peptide/nickel transport system substrate-binding protein n=1 Tax=Sanguibacter gelidistatuariae TaxID=1814289 RepID=A0A1G6JC77_9MICO|nr:peptide/nickel transport system substrate-binding protein [Sanguibacter gelidistatuariae]